MASSTPALTLALILAFSPLVAAILHPSPSPSPSPSQSSSSSRSHSPPDGLGIRISSPPKPRPREGHRPRRIPGPPPQRLNFGQKLGLLFAGVVIILQVGFAGFLVFKKFQLKKLEGEPLQGRRGRRRSGSSSSSSSSASN